MRFFSLVANLKTLRVENREVFKVELGGDDAVLVLAIAWEGEVPQGLNITAITGYKASRIR